MNRNHHNKAEKKGWPFFVWFLFLFFRATLAAYGGSQARGRIAMQDPSCTYDLHHSSRQCRILNPLSKASDRTCVLMDANQIHYDGNFLAHKTSIKPYFTVLSRIF